MNISYPKVANEIFKILKGIGYSVEMYDQDGNGPLSSAKLAKYIYTKPDNMMIELPTGNSKEVMQIVFYKPESMDLEVFKNLFTRIKNIARLYGLEITVRSFAKTITPKDFAYRASAKHEEREKALSETIIPHLINYLKD